MRARSRREPFHRHLPLVDVPDLYICDGSVFVTSSGVNPRLTIQALAARTADHLVAAGRHREL